MSSRIPAAYGPGCMHIFPLSGMLMCLWTLVGTSSLLGESNGTPLQYSCLENPMDCGAWWAAVHGVVKSQTRRSDFPFTFMHWRRKWQSTPVFLPGESQGWGSLVGCRLRGRTELDTTEATQQQQQLACFFFTTGEMARSGRDGVW